MKNEDEKVEGSRIPSILFIRENAYSVDISRPSLHPHSLHLQQYLH